MGESQGESRPLYNENLNPVDREVFRTDGSLRDIYLMGTNAVDWQRLCDHLTSKYETVFVWDPDDITELPPVGEVLANSDRSGTLTVTIGDLRYNTHFFKEREIELDFWPEAVRTQEHVEAVLAFMTELGDLLDREVILTPENQPELPHYRYRPGQGRPEHLARK